MKLAKYLADYIEHEKEAIEDDSRREYDILDYEMLIQQGIEAFELTEQVQVTIIDAADGKMPWREGTNLE